MKIVTFTRNGNTEIGEWIDDTIYGLAWSDSIMSLIQRGLTPNRNGEYYPLDAVTLKAPLRPGKIIAIGRNYAEHAAETGNEPPPAPLIFSIFPSAVIGPGETITWHSSIAKEVDWEVELAVIIGRRARHVSEENALNHVFGYTIGNDISARDLQLRIDGQWTRGKSLDTFCPLGPCIVTRNDIPDPQNLQLQMYVNDELMQDGHTSDMIFGVKYLIAYCSRMFTLNPGDIIMTGTPPGVGEGMTPKRYLADGDVVTAIIEGIGELRNPVRILSD